MTQDHNKEQVSAISPVDLSPIGVNSFAWPVDATINLLHWLDRHTKLVVLGGDLLKNADKKIEFLGENWSYEPAGAESDHAESIEKALEYLEKIKKKEQVIVDLVVR